MPRNCEKWRARYARWRFRRRVIGSLALNRRGEVRADGHSLQQLQNRLQIEWRARAVHSWDRDLPPDKIVVRFAEQCLDDASAAIDRLFRVLPEIELVDFRVVDPKSSAEILCGVVGRGEAKTVVGLSSGMKLKKLGARYRLSNWCFEPLG